MKIRIAGMYVITDGVHPGQESLQGDEERAEGNEGRAPTEDTKVEQPERGGETREHVASEKPGRKREGSNRARVQAFPGRQQRGSDPWASGKTVWGGEMGGSQAGGV